MTTRFDTDTAVTSIGAGRYAARIDPGWWIVLGPNGGYVAAILLRALRAAEPEAEREPRSLTIHYTRPPKAGPIEIACKEERRGRSLTTWSARMEQDGKLVALALAAFSKPREAREFHHAVMPSVAPPEQIAPAAEVPFPMHARYEYRWAIGDPPLSGAKEALCGGWIRFAEPRVPDALAVTAFCDAWPPAVFALSRPGEALGAVPTVDLTIHFRRPLPLSGAQTSDFVLAVFRSREAGDGFVEEDGEIWSRDGQLLAQSRQLAILV